MTTKSPTTSTVVPATYSPGFPRRKAEIFKWMRYMTAAYFLCYIPGSKLNAHSRNHCPEQSEDEFCSRPDLFAFEAVCVSVFIYVTANAFPFWRVAHKAVPDTPEGRIFGHIPEGEQLAAVLFTFQVWDFLISFLIPEMLTPIMMGHHILAATACWFSLQYQCYHYYAIYFLGLSEFSSIPLAIMTTLEYFPPPEGSFFVTIKEICGPCFAVLFLYYRLFSWSRVSYMFWKDSHYVISNGILEQFREGRSYTLYFTLAINALLTALQVYWSHIILLEVGKAVGLVDKEG